MNDRPSLLIRLKRLALAMLLLSLTGCRGVSEEELNAPIVPLQAWSAAETQGKLQPFPPKVTNQLQRLINRSVGDAELPGVVLYLATSDGVWMGTGTADRQSPKVLKPTDRFRAATVTELFVSVVCLQLVEDGKLDLDAPIDRYLPQVVKLKLKNSKWITVRQLLNHTSGLAEPDPQALKQATAANPKRKWTAQTILELLPDREQAVPQGNFFHASTNYLLLQLIVEQVTGQSLATAIRDRISQPLKLSNTFLEQQEPIPGGFVSGNEDWNRDSKRDPVTQPLINTGSGLGGSGIVSNAPDLTRFFQALFAGDALLYPSSLSQMLTLTEDGRGGYGLGIRHSQTPWGEAWGQAGSTTGFSAVLLYLPVHDLTIAVLTNEGDRKMDKPYDVVKKSLDIILGLP